MEHNIYGREWERALRKYDELAIRYDQIKKVFEVIYKQGLQPDQLQPS